MKLVILPNLTDRKGRTYSAAEINDNIRHTPEFFGTMSGDEVTLTNISHKVHSLYIENGSLHGSISFNRTPRGVIVSNLSKVIPFQPSIRGVGVLDGLTVRDFNLQGIDLAPVNDSFFMDLLQFKKHTGVQNPICIKMQLDNMMVDMNHIVTAISRLNVPIGCEIMDNRIEVYFRDTTDSIRFSIMVDPSVRQIL